MVDHFFKLVCLDYFDFTLEVYAWYSKYSQSSPFFVHAAPQLCLFGSAGDFVSATNEKARSRCSACRVQFFERGNTQLLNQVQSLCRRAPFKGAANLGAPWLRSLTPFCWQRGSVPAREDHYYWTQACFDWSFQVHHVFVPPQHRQVFKSRFQHSIRHFWANFAPRPTFSVFQPLINLKL